MAKIGTAHVEIKPVLDEAALAALTDRVAEAVAEGVRRGMASHMAGATVTGEFVFDADTRALVRGVVAEIHARGRETARARR